MPLAALLGGPRRQSKAALPRRANPCARPPAVDGRHFYFGPAVGAGAMLFIVTALAGGAAYDRSGANNRRAKRGLEG
jgi:hypothetical protein